MNALPALDALWAHEPEDALQAISSAVDQLTRNPEDETVLNWLLGVAESAMDTGLMPVAEMTINLTKHAFVEAKVAVDARAQADLDGLEGMLALRMGRSADAVPLLTTAAEEQKALGNVLGQARALQNLALASHVAGSTDLAKSQIEEALVLCEELRDEYRQAQCLLNQAQFAVDAKDFEEADSLLLRAAEMSRSRDAWHLRTSIIGVQARRASLCGDPDKAGILSRKALRRSRRGGDSYQIRVATQNLGAWYAEQKRPTMAAKLLERAATMAESMGDLTTAQSLWPAHAVQLAERGDFVNAAASMRRALHLAESLEDAAAVARSKSDLAAVLINMVQVQTDAGHALPDESADLDQAADLLSNALRHFSAAGDDDWIVRAAMNLCAAELLRHRPHPALDALTSALDWISENVASSRADLYRRATAVAVEDVHNPDLAADFVRRAAECVSRGASLASMPPVNPDMRTEPALRSLGATSWELALGASALADHDYARPHAAALFSEAAEAAQAADRSELLFHINNDRALVLVHLEREQEAHDLLRDCLALAAQHDDRVMRQLATANLGELARRRGEPEARGLLQEAVDLAEALDDHGAEISALSNLALLDIQEVRPSSAEAAIHRALSLVQIEDSTSDIEGQLFSLLGSCAETKGDFEAAKAIYTKSAQSTSGADRAFSICEALAASARLPGRQSYMPSLGRLVRASQADGVEIQASEYLVFTAQAWLKRRSLRPGARMLATSLALRIAGWSKTDPTWSDSLLEVLDESSKSDAVPSTEGFRGFLAALASIANALLELPTQRQHAVLDAMEVDLQSMLSEEVGTFLVQFTRGAVAAVANDEAPDN